MKDTDITPEMQAESDALWAKIDLDNERRRRRLQERLTRPLKEAA